MGIINQKSLPEKTADAILHFIRCNDYQIGAKLPNEYDLAQELEVSRNTIRRAIKMLVDKNMLEVRKGSGTFISKKMGVSDDPLGLSLTYDKKKMTADLILLRILIEPKMASLAAQYATPLECQKLINLCEEMEELFHQHKTYLLKDLEFHALIAACSRNIAVHNMLPSIHQTLSLQNNILDELLGQRTIDAHKEIAKAISKGLASDAYDAMLAHLMQNSDRISRIQ